MIAPSRGCTCLDRSRGPCSGTWDPSLFAWAPRVVQAQKPGSRTPEHGSTLCMTTPILWLHGFPLDARVFENQISLGGLMPDLPGFGTALPPDRELAMDDYARFALDALDARGIERAIFAGLSMGGYICFAAARLAPERVGGLILIDTRATADTDEA